MRRKFPHAVSDICVRTNTYRYINMLITIAGTNKNITILRIGLFLYGAQCQWRISGASASAPTPFEWPPLNCSEELFPEKSTNLFQKLLSVDRHLNFEKWFGPSFSKIS